MIHAYPLRSLLTASLLAASLGLWASAASAQTLEELKKQDSRFIDWLKEKGAADVMAYYAKNHPSKDEKTLVSVRIAVAQTTIDGVREKARGSAADKQMELFTAMRKATEELLVAERERCDKFADDDSALLWQTQLLSDQVDNYLRIYRNNAAEAYEYGSPDADQSQAFEEQIPSAFTLAVHTAATAGKVQSRMMGDRNYGKKLIKAGLKSRIEDAQKESKKWLGATAYWMTLLPDTHPYFANLGKPGSIVVPGQKATIADERKRLLAVAIDSLDHQDMSFLGMEAKALAARVLLAQGKKADAAKYTAAMDPGEFTEAGDAQAAARAICAKAKVVNATGGFNEAVKYLRDQAAHNPAIAAQLKAKDASAYLFVCDAAYRLLMDASKQAKPPQDVELFNKAFMDPYADVLAEKIPGVDGESAKAIHALRSTLFYRWKKAFANTPADKLPGIIATETLAIEMGEIFAAGGLWEQVKKAVDEKEQPDAAKVKQLTEKMRHVEAGLIPFTQNKVQAVRAKMLDQLALLRFLGAQVGVYLVYDPKQNIAAADQTAHASAVDWLRIADEMPDSAQAQQAMDYAAYITHGQHASSLYVPNYAAAGKVLFAKYAKSNTAARERSYYVDNVLVPAGKMDEALKILADVAADDVFYFVAKQKAVIIQDRSRRALQSAVDTAKATGTQSADAEVKLNAAVEGVIKSATDLVEDARKEEKNGAAGYRRASAHAVRAATLVLLANAYGAKGKADQGVSLLEGLEAEFGPDSFKAEDFDGKENDLHAMQKNLKDQVEYGQISRLRMLVEAGRVEQVKSQAGQLLAGGNPVAVSMLKSLNLQLKLEVDRLKDQIAASKVAFITQELETKRQRYGKAMLELTGILCEKLLPTATEQQKESLEILRAQAKSASGDTAGAVADMDRLLAEEDQAFKEGKKKSRSLDLILGAAQAYYDHAKGMPEDSKERKQLLIKANNSAKRIASHYREQAPNPETGYPAAFYDAFWIQMSAIDALQPTSDKIKELRRNIPTSIEEMRQADPKGYSDLPWNDRFEKLLLKIQVENQSGGK